MRTITMATMSIITTIRDENKCALTPGGRHFVGCWTASR